jgi:hypothetical protein
MKLLLTCLLSCCAGVAVAQDRADIDTSKIIGNRELPKVLTIVPWKKPLPGALMGRPVQSVLDDALAPIDREVLGRQISYGAQLQAGLPNRPARTTPPADLPTNSPAPATGEKR